MSRGNLGRDGGIFLFLLRSNNLIAQVNMTLKFVKKIVLFFACVGACACTPTPDSFQYDSREPLFICTNKPLGDLKNLKISLNYGSRVFYNSSSGDLSFSLVGTITNTSEEPIVIPDARSQYSGLLLTDKGCVEGAYTTDLFLDGVWKNCLQIQEDSITWLLPTCRREKAFRGILIEGGQCMRFELFFCIEKVKIKESSSTLKVKIVDPEGRFTSNEIEFFIWDSWKM